MRPSSRSAVDLTKNALTLALEQRKRAGKPLLDLTVANPTEASLPYPTDEIREALDGSRLFEYRPAPLGMWEARCAVAKELSTTNNEVAPWQVVLTASTSEAYAYLFKLLCDPGDEVAVPRPSYPLLDWLARLECVELRRYALTYDGEWHLPPVALDGVITSRTRAIVAVQPNNPTGSYLDTTELQALLATELPVISDEVFLPYAHGPTPAAPGSILDLARDARQPCFALGGLSKHLGLPQLKLGWIVVAGREAEARAALSHLEVIADTYLSVATPVQLALAALFEVGAATRAAIRERTATNLGTLIAVVGNDSPATLLRIEGGWYAVLRLPSVYTEEEWALLLLEEEGIWVQPGFFYDLTGGVYIVISLLPRGDVFREGVTRLARCIAERS